MRYGLTIPVDALSLPQHREFLRELVDLGYTDVWTGESEGPDGLTPLALAAAWVPELQLGTAILPVFTRGTAVLAQTAATMAAAAPGRFTLGIGSSTPPIVERWNAQPFDRPYQRVRDTIRFLRQALRGERVDEDYETFSIRGFRLRIVPEVLPPIHVAALRPGMLRLAAREADGVILNMLGADDVGRVLPYARESGSEAEVVARIIVCPTTDPAEVEPIASVVAAYLCRPPYGEFHDWLGRGPLLEPMREVWHRGDRESAVRMLPPEVLDEVVIHGSPDECRERIASYVERGVTIPVLAVMLPGEDPRPAIRALRPGR